MVHIKRIPLQYDRRTNRYFPRFLSKEDDPLILGAINEFERALEELESDPRKSDFIERFDEYKIGVCLYETLSNQFYPFPKISGKFYEGIGKYRLKLWEIVNREYNGVIFDPISRKEVLEKLRVYLPQEYKDLGYETLNAKLFFNYTYRIKRVRPAESPDPSVVRKAVNLDIIRGLCRYSQAVEIKIPFPHNITSKEVKWLFYLSKRFGIFTRITKSDDGLYIRIIGPEELIGRREKYGRKIQVLIEKLIHQRIQNPVIKDWLLHITIPWGQKTRLIFFDLSKLPELTFIDMKAEKNMEFDSKTEEEFFHILTALKPWKVSREPETLIENNLIFIPDFSLAFADLKPVYIEVVGFWTDDYKAKKIEKITELAKTATFPLVLIVDSNLNFPKIPPFPSFEYSSDLRSILVPLNQYLNETYLVTYEKKRITYLIDNIITEVERIISKTENEGIISESTLQDNLGILEQKDLHNIFSNESQMAYLNEKDWKYIPKVGLVKIETIRSWKKQISRQFSIKKRSHLDLEVIQPIFPNNFPVQRFLEYLGYTVKWQQLHKITVLRPSKKRKR